MHSLLPLVCPHLDRLEVLNLVIWIIQQRLALIFIVVVRLVFAEGPELHLVITVSFQVRVCLASMCQAVSLGFNEGLGFNGFNFTPALLIENQHLFSLEVHVLFVVQQHRQHLRVHGFADEVLDRVAVDKLWLSALVALTPEVLGDCHLFIRHLV